MAFKTFAFSLMIVVFSSGAFAELEVTGLFSRATVPGTDTGVVYGTLHNDGDEPVSVVDVVSPVAKKAQMHRTTRSDGMSSMVHVPTLRLDAGETARFEPGGLHIMLMGLKAPLEKDASFEITFILADGTRIRHKVIVGAVGQMEMPHGAE